ncbi:PREDICTED: S-type anion channel SLAH4-like [Ipomoea nil]|uniref:S-type anion channel SLAH4-like n=1 Tax=Ipomoea nil TaxID=35883 RepID=UPI0009011814|nr:PREDICTED: S-type anion channel SLAH4-like [Ipomoea nil]
MLPAMANVNQESQPQAEVVVNVTSTIEFTGSSPQNKTGVLIKAKALILPILMNLHAGYFRISLSLCSQALLWKTLSEPPSDGGAGDIHSLRKMLHRLPSTAFFLLWCFALFTLVSLSLIYVVRCFLRFDMVKNEFLHHVGVNYLFAPWISWLLLLQATPFFKPKTTTAYYLVLWWVFVVPIVALDVKIYGQWFTKGKRYLSGIANPTSQMSVIGNLVCARAAAQMGWKESAICMFSLGMAHYFVLFVTLYQRLPGSGSIPAILRPVFFLFFAAPSMASLAWDSISGNFDNSSKMLFYLSLFLFISLVCRPALFKKSMKKFNVAWWAYSFPLTAMAMASTEYAQAVKSTEAHILMLILSGLSVLVLLLLLLCTALNTTLLLPAADDHDGDHSSIVS